MDNILKVLYDHFYRMPENTPDEKRIEANHRLLSQRLSKRNRKLVLRIIDDKDLICSDVSLDSFICGFRLAWQIANEIQNYDGCSDCSQKAEPVVYKLSIGGNQMKKTIITGIVITACVVLCAAVWPRNTANKVIPVTQEKPAISADLAAMQEEPLHIIFSADTPSPEPAETKESTAEKEQASSPPDEAILEPEVTSTPEPTSTPSSAPKTATSSAPPSPDPKPGTIAVIDGNQCMWIPGFGWVKDEGGGAQGTTVGSPGDELTGNKVGQMGGGTIADGKGDINKMVGIMGEDDTPSSEKSTPAPGTKAVIKGKPSVWISGFGWIEDNGGGSVGTVAEDMYENGNKIGSMN